MTFDCEIIGTQNEEEDDDSYLHGCLDSVDGHEEDTEQCRGSTGGDGLDADAHVLGGIHGIQEGEHSGVGGRITEAGERTLDQSRCDTTVEAGNATVGVQSP